ncbi:MAG: hypothetical protein AAF557_22410 [Pseudomonadota bacterium]
MRVLLVLVVIALPGVGHTLSCLRPNPAIELNRYFKQDRDVAVLIGEIEPAGIRPFRLSTEKISAAYHFSGTAYGMTGEVRAPEKIRYVSRCAGNWCSSVPKGKRERLFVAVKSSDGVLEITTGPCNEHHHATPEDHQIRAIRLCFASRGCSSRIIQLFDD